MEKCRILVKNVTGKQAIQIKDGENIQKNIVLQINKGNCVVLDFSGVESVLSLFLNPAIGDLYGIFDEEKIKKCLSIENIPTEYAETFIRVINRAKQFYNNREDISKIISSETDDEDE